MVHTWISLRTDKVYQKSLNKKASYFRNYDINFYGDYDLDIYITSKNDYDNLEQVTQKVIMNNSGWISNCQLSKILQINHLQSIINMFGYTSERGFKVLFPYNERKTNYQVIKCLEYRNDGNFKMLACETSRFYYVFCFATS